MDAEPVMVPRFTGKSTALLGLVSDPEPREMQLHQPTPPLWERVPRSFQMALHFSAGQTEFPVHSLDLQLAFSVSGSPPGTVFLYVAYTRQQGVQRQDVAGTPMGVQLGAAWFTPLIRDTRWYS